MFFVFKYEFLVLAFGSTKFLGLRVGFIDSCQVSGKHSLPQFQTHFLKTNKWHCVSLVAWFCPILRHNFPGNMLTHQVDFRLFPFRMSDKPMWAVFKKPIGWSSHSPYIETMSGIVTEIHEGEIPFLTSIEEGFEHCSVKSHPDNHSTCLHHIPIYCLRSPGRDLQLRCSLCAMVKTSIGIEE